MTENASLSLVSFFSSCTITQGTDSVGVGAGADDGDANTKSWPFIGTAFMLLGAVSEYMFEISSFTIARIYIYTKKIKNMVPPVLCISQCDYECETTTSEVHMKKCIKNI
jgi:hypothetical protein